MRWIVLLWGMFVAMDCLAATTAPASAPNAPASAPTTASVSPIEAAKRFAKAFSNPTRDGLRVSVAGRTPAEEKAADLWAESMAAQFRLQELVKSKFGDEGYASVFGRPPRPRPSPQDMAKQLDQMFAGANVETGPTEARVTVTAGAGSDQLWLTRTPDGWKAWIGAVLQARSPELIDNFVRNNADYGKVRDKVADDIEAGKISTARDARDALTRLEDEAAAKVDPASTQVATPEQGKIELREKLRKMQEIEAERDRLEREAATRPVR